MASFKYTLDLIILGIYEFYMKNGIITYSVEYLHRIIQSTVTVMPTTIANYIKQLKNLGYLELKNNSFTITDKLLEKGKLLYEQKITPVDMPKQSEIDNTDFYKY